MRKAYWVALALALSLVLALGIAAVACGGDKETTTTAAPVTTAPPASETTAPPASETTAPPASETTMPPYTSPIKIGVAISLTGDSAAPCTLVKEGFEAETDYINKNGGINGRQIELSFADDQSKIDTATVAITQLIDDGMDVIVGPFPQWTTGPARQLTEEAGVFHLAFGPPTLVELMEDQTQYTYSFETASGPDGMADAWLKAIQGLGFKNVLGIADQINIHQEGLQLMVQLCAENGINFTKMNDSWGLGEADVTPVCNLIAAKAAEVKPDLVIVSSNPVHVNIIAKTLRGLGVTAPIMGGGASTHPLAMFAPAGNDPANVAGDYGVGPSIVSIENCPDEYPAKQDVKRFVDNWKAMFPEEAFGSVHLGFSYDCLNLAKLAIESATEQTPEGWAEAMKSIDWWGAAGHFQYSETDRIGIHGGFMLWQFQPDATFKYVMDLNAMTE